MTPSKFLLADIFTTLMFLVGCGVEISILHPGAGNSHPKVDRNF